MIYGILNAIFTQLWGNHVMRPQRQIVEELQAGIVVTEESAPHCVGAKKWLMETGGNPKAMEFLKHYFPEIKGWDTILYDYEGHGRDTIADAYWTVCVVSGETLSHLINDIGRRIKSGTNGFTP